MDVTSTLTLQYIKELKFHSLEVVSRYRDPQLQVDENYSYLYNLNQIFVNVTFLMLFFTLKLSGL